MPKKKKKNTRKRKKISKKLKNKSKIKKKSSKKIKKKIKVQNQETNQVSEVIIKTKPEWIKSSLANKSKYQQKYSQSIKSNDEFWRKEGKRITWIKPYKKIKDVKYSTKDVRIKWFEDGTLNASVNCIDRHLKDKKDKTAIIWVGDDPKDSQKITYKQLHQKVSRAANGLKKLGIKKGD
ncbi:AMP-binding protein, partial [Candidatus Pelagibacter sp.]|nr:AMP-binding protein [Candidatus Pelagibacter sp.]